MSETTLKAKHEAWKARRGTSTDESLTAQGGIVLVSYSPGPLNNGVSELLTRFGSLKGTTSCIPPSWSLALLVLDALMFRMDPLRPLTCPLPSSEVRRTWIDKKAIAEAWKDMQNVLPPGEKAGDPSFAMESALNLGAFAVSSVYFHATVDV